MLVHNGADWINRIACGSAPLVAYAAMLVFAVMLMRKSDLAGDVLVFGVVLLLVVNILNARGLTSVTARRHSAVQSAGNHREDADVQSPGLCAGAAPRSPPSTCCERRLSVLCTDIVVVSLVIVRIERIEQCQRT